MRDVLLVCPTARDLAAVRDLDGWRIRTLGDDADGPEPFDPDALLAEAVSIPADGVVGTKDRAALLAALVARERGLSGPDPLAVVGCQHKGISRPLQEVEVPEAVPPYAVVRDSLPLPAPCFVKPVVGRLSQGAFRLDDPAQLPEPLHDGYHASFVRMAALAGADGIDASGWLAEELLEGDEVTLEGYVHGGAVVVIGVTDSVHYPGTRSFERFEYPSRLPQGRLDELAEVATRLAPALRLDGAFFNVEFSVPERGPAKVIEVNARIASQFAPLVAATHGRSTYDALFALACGDDPGWHGGEPDGVAVSYVMRVFEDALVESVPPPEPGVEILVRPGRRLSEQGLNDVASYRLAIFSEHGATRAEALERCRRRSAELLPRFTLRPPA